MVIAALAGIALVAEGLLAQLAHPAMPLIAFLVLGLVALFVVTLVDPTERQAVG